MVQTLRIQQPARRVAPEVVQRYRGVPVAFSSDCMNRLPAGGPDLRPMHGHGTPLAGPAYTVRTRPGDNLFVHKAIDLASPGDVLVVDAGGECTNAIVGEMMLTHAETRGLAGAVIYGAIRDSGHVGQHPFPVFACGVTHRGPFQSGPGEVNVPIAIAGMVIEPGDLILGDDDGTLCIPFDQLDEVYPLAAERLARENAQRERVRNGTVDRKWIDDRLAACGFKFEYL